MTVVPSGVGNTSTAERARHGGRLERARPLDGVAELLQRLELAAERAVDQRTGLETFGR